MQALALIAYTPFLIAAAMIAITIRECAPALRNLIRSI